LNSALWAGPKWIRSKKEFREGGRNSREESIELEVREETLLLVGDSSLMESVGDRGTSCE